MAIRRGKDGSGVAHFGPVCGDCPLLEQCTTAAGGHSIRSDATSVGSPRQGERHAEPEWIADHPCNRPRWHARSRT